MIEVQDLELGPRISWIMAAGLTMGISTLVIGVTEYLWIGRCKEYECSMNPLFEVMI